MFSVLCKRLGNRHWLLALAASVTFAQSSWGADAKPSAAEEAVRKTAAAFVDAFNRGNAKEIAALWTADGSLVDEAGQITKGRAAIEAKYDAYFKATPGAKMEVAVKSIEFPTPLVAIEDGTARVSVNGGPATWGRYAAVHALDKGKWLMASVRESETNDLSAAEHLADLAWLIGTWEHKSDDLASQSTFRWTSNKNFIQREYVTRRKGQVTASGMQLIGWDPQASQIRSWSFDSTGGYGSGYWSVVQDGWRIQSSGVQNDGTPTSAFDVLIQVPGESNVFGWRSLDRRVGSVRFPNTPEVVFDRVPDAKVSDKK